MDSRTRVPLKKVGRKSAASTAPAPKDFVKVTTSSGSELRIRASSIVAVEEHPRGALLVYVYGLSNAFEISGDLDAFLRHVDRAYIINR